VERKGYVLNNENIFCMWQRRKKWGILFWQEKGTQETTDGGGCRGTIERNEGIDQGGRLPS